MTNFTPWALEPHTQAKHNLLKLYLDRWFPILGDSEPRLNYFDGFAGPGEYEGGEKGSPLIAIESAKKHVKQGTLGPDVQVNFIFVEHNKSHVAHLTKILADLDRPDQFQFRIIEGAFEANVDEILSKLEGEGKRLAPTFAFVDPFGFSGIPLSLIARILKFPKCEIFINIMVEEINRFLEHPNPSITAHFREAFDTDEVLNLPNAHRVSQLLALYKRQLSQHAKFVRRFDMRGRRDQKKYSLFFASNNARGFEKMKEAMWAVDKASGMEFSAADVRSGHLFEEIGFSLLWDELRDTYAGRTVRMSDLETFVIEKTDYLVTHIRPILIQREGSGEISVKPLPIPGYKRRPETFPSKKVQIVFSA